MFAILGARAPRAVLLYCNWGGGGVVAAEEMLIMEAAIDPEWRALECLRTKGWEQGVSFTTINLRISKAPMCSQRHAHK